MISIHAPTRGATSVFALSTVVAYISIHAPTRGATETPFRRYIRSVISIHAPTRGATVSSVETEQSMVFQSTLPREERHEHQILFQYIDDNFNPRSHERSDRGLKSMLTKWDISIHAPTRGATNRDIFRIIFFLFQSTLPREERPKSG